MRFHLPCLVSFAALAGALAAQIPQIPPAVTKFVTPTSTTPFIAQTFPQLGPAAIGIASLTASSTLELRRIGTAGTFFRLALVGGGVPPVFGGVGGSDAVEGVFDAATNVVQLSNLAAAFNVAGVEDGFSISEDGLVAVGGGAVIRWSSRAAIGTAWPATQVVTGIPVIATPVLDPKLYTDGTQRKLAWADKAGAGGFGGNIWVGDFNAGVVSNAVMLMPHALARRGLHSPHPVTEEIPAGSGNWVVHGWFLGAQWNAQDADSVWLPGKDPSVAATAPPRPLFLWNEPRFQHNGTSLGNSGTTFWLWDQRDDPVCIPSVALSGATFSAAGGGTVRMRLLVPFTTTETWLTAVFFGPPISPLSVPGTIGNPLGQLGPAVPFGQLAISPIVTIQAPVNPANPGGVTFSFSIAPGSVPPGVPVPMQGVGVNLTTAKIYLANTAAIEGL